MKVVPEGFWTEVGVWVWGAVTVALALGFLALVILAGLHIEYDGSAVTFSGIHSESPLPGLYYAVKENGSLIAGILGFSGLAWSHFFQGHRSIKARRDSKTRVTES